MSLRTLCVILLGIVPSLAMSQGMTIVRVVVTTETGVGSPVPVAGAVVTALGVSRLTDSLGRASVLMGDATARPVIQVRRIGFLPREVPISFSGDTTAIEVRLERLSMSLPAVRSTATSCGDADASSAGAALPRIIDQIQQNARTYVALVNDRPFTYELQRVRSDRMVSGREIVTDVDTFQRAPLLDARYVPGGAIAYYIGPGGDYRQAVMKLPELADFADPVFIEAHCFRYAGLDSVTGRRVIRIEFEPDTNVHGPDIGGALLLDARTYVLVRATLELRNIPDALAGEVAAESVTTDFGEAFAGAPIVAAVSAATKLPGARGIGGVVTRLEVHRLIRVLR